MNFPLISIITINYNGFDDTVECLKSLGECDYPNFEIFLIDNGSGGNQAEKLAKIKMKNLRFFASKKNLGFAGGNNFAIKKVLKEGKSKYIYFLNNDTVVEPDFLGQAVKTAETDPRIGVVASLSLQYFNRDFIENAGHYSLNCGDFVPRGRNLPRGKMQKKCEILGACSAGALYKTETLRQCGLYDESFFLNYEDADLSMRCVLYGWKCVYEPKSVIYHKVNASIKKHRDYVYALRSQQNLLKAYFYNMPAMVVLLDLPFFILRDLAVIFVNTIFLKFQIVKLFLHARFLFLKNLKNVLRERAKRMKHKRVSWWYIFKKQKNFIPFYYKYFVEIILKGRKSGLQSRANM